MACSFQGCVWNIRFNLICRNGFAWFCLQLHASLMTLSVPANRLPTLRLVLCNISQEVQKFLYLLHIFLQHVRSSIRGLLLP